MAENLENRESRGAWADVLRTAIGIFRSREGEEPPLKAVRQMLEQGELGGAEMAGAVLPGAGLLGIIPKVKTPAARFLRKVFERAGKSYRGPGAAKPVVGKVLTKTRGERLDLPLPGYQEVWKEEYIKALRGATQKRETGKGLVLDIFK